MPSIREIDAFMSDWAKKEYSEPWDNDGVMLCADLNENVKSILVCLEINERVCTTAKECGANLIVTHHPYIFKGLRSISGADYKMTKLLIEGGISVLSYHTRLDAAQGGVNDVLAQRIGLSHIVPFGEGGLGRVGTLSTPVTAEDFAFHLKSRLSCGTMKVYIPQGKTIEKVAVVGGAGKDFLCDAAPLCDAYVTGDLSHNSFIDAREYGVALFDAGHYFTENPVVQEIAKRLGESFPDAKISTSDSLCPYECI